MLLSTMELDPAEIADLAMEAGDEADDLLRGSPGQAPAIWGILQVMRQPGEGPLATACKTLERGYCGYAERMGRQTLCLDAVVGGSRTMRDLLAVRELCYSLHDAILAGPAPQPYLIWKQGDAGYRGRPSRRTRGLRPGR